MGSIKNAVKLLLFFPLVFMKCLYWCYIPFPLYTNTTQFCRIDIPNDPYKQMMISSMEFWLVQSQSSSSCISLICLLQAAEMNWGQVNGKVGNKSGVPRLPIPLMLTPLMLQLSATGNLLWASLLSIPHIQKLYYVIERATLQQRVMQKISDSLLVCDESLFVPILLKSW